jgi:hypothetical protein
MGYYISSGDQDKKGSEENIFSVSSIGRQTAQNSSRDNIKRRTSTNNICRLLGFYT